MNTREIARIYSNYAHEYDDVYGWVFEKGRRRAVALLNAQPGEKILDVGVGTGLTLPLYPDGVHIFGTDVSQKMLQKAREKFDTVSNKNIHLFEMDAAHLNFPNNYFDKVLGAYILGASDKPKEILSEISRVLKLEGLAVFVNHFKLDTPIMKAVEWWLKPIGKERGFFTAIDLKDTFKNTPFQIIKVESVNIFGALSVVMAVNGGIRKTGNSKIAA